MRICVYCASSQQSDAAYRAAATRVGELIAEAGHSLVYGGGSSGSMGAVADGALSRGGKVIGILPRFMADLEWGHPGLTQLELVEDMRERKHRLLTGSDAVIALPGGCGTLEELFEAITLKRLGLYLNPIVLLDTRGFYAPLETFMAQVIAEHFMNPEHAAMWQRVAEPEQVLPAIANAPTWNESARDYAVVRAPAA
ncbi:MAG TPA: TIGR00730 family Rossman fold protein [Rhodanobacteraceae bacterium]|nr:TIGR00730 family Rossman fold protein [Rhodanobacteraceae bacterium]